jgi:hypothetical protein
MAVSGKYPCGNRENSDQTRLIRHVSSALQGTAETPENDRSAFISPLTNWTRIESMHVGVVQIET